MARQYRDFHIDLSSAGRIPLGTLTYHFARMIPEDLLAAVRGKPARRSYDGNATQLVVVSVRAADKQT